MASFRLPPAFVHCVFSIGATLLLNQLATAQSESEPFPFVIKDLAKDSVAAFTELNPRAAGDDGFCRVVDGHFANDAGRLKVWGVNLCFGANFPEHAEATKLANRLAAHGINGVRIHHQETSLSPNGLYSNDGAMDPIQVDKLDYLLAELHKNGIYANINLHVGRSVRQSLGMPELGQGHSATGDKHAMHFMPQLQESFWQYCRDYLGHVNPYRKLARANDPAVAMVEILNENRFSRDGVKFLAGAPEPYRTEILKQWNAWLTTQYQHDATLRASWKTEGTSSGAVIADSRVFDGPSDQRRREAGGIGGDWIVLDSGGKFPIEFVIDSAQGAIKISPTKPSPEGWQQQLACENLSFVKGSQYTLTLECRADQERSFSYNTATLEGGWEQLGLGGSVLATPQWKPITVVFTATQTINNTGRLAFDLGGDAQPIELRKIQLRSGAGLVTIPDGQSLAQRNVAIPDSKSTAKAQSAFLEFMKDTERNFYRATTRVLRDELGLRVPLCTTQTNYIGADLAAELGDYTDMHSYWNHPLFLGREWDQSNWSIGHEPIEASPFANQWPLNSPLMRGAWRVHGKPFTYSEWNIGEPSVPSAGAVPIMSILGALQDWDAVFFFDFEDKGGVWDLDRLDGYFRFNSQPCKLALLGPFGQLYRNSDLNALTEKLSSAEGSQQRDGVLGFTKLIGLDPTLPRVEGNSPPSHEELAETHPPLLETADGTAIWDARDPTKATMRIDTLMTKAIGGLIGGQSTRLGDWEIQFGTIPHNYGVFIAVSRDGKPVTQSDSILVTIVNHAENSVMKWNEAGNSVSDQWGDGPTITWGVPAKLTIPQRDQEVFVYALDSTGKRDSQVPTRVVSGKVTIELGPEHETLMYEITTRQSK